MLGETLPTRPRSPCAARTGRARRARCARKPSASIVVERDADDPAAGNEPGAGQMEQARQQLALRQIAGGADQDDDLRMLRADARRNLRHGPAPSSPRRAPAAGIGAKHRASRKRAQPNSARAARRTHLGDSAETRPAPHPASPREGAGRGEERRRAPLSPLAGRGRVRGRGIGRTLRQIRACHSLADYRTRATEFNIFWVRRAAPPQSPRSGRSEVQQPRSGLTAAGRRGRGELGIYGRDAVTLRSLEMKLPSFVHPNLANNVTHADFLRGRP